jgi:hypothetical protein
MTIPNLLGKKDSSLDLLGYNLARGLPQVYESRHVGKFEYTIDKVAKGKDFSAVYLDSKLPHNYFRPDSPIEAGMAQLPQAYAAFEKDMPFQPFDPIGKGFYATIALTNPAVVAAMLQPSKSMNNQLITEVGIESKLKQYISSN